MVSLQSCPSSFLACRSLRIGTGRSSAPWQAVGWPLTMAWSISYLVTAPAGTASLWEDGLDGGSPECHDVEELLAHAR